MIANSPLGLNFGIPGLFNPLQSLGGGCCHHGHGIGDGFRGSAGLFDQPFGLGGLGNGFGNPMMGLGGMNQMGGNNMAQALMLLMALMQMQQQQGMGGPMGGGMPFGQMPFGAQPFGAQPFGQFPGAGFQQPFGMQPQSPFMAGLGAGLSQGLQGQQMNPAFAFGLGAGLGMAMAQMNQRPGFGQMPFGPQFGQSPFGPQFGQSPFGQFGQQPFNPQAFAAGAAMGLMNGMGGMNQMGGPGMGQGGGCIDLQQGQSFTTPGGAQINWQGDTVTVKEPGGGVQQQNVGGGGDARGFGAQNAFAMAGAFSGQGFSGAFAMAGTMGAPGPIGACGCHHGQQNQQPAKDWKVWGDPHIKNPDGSQGEFDRKNALFSLNDGTKILMGADNPKAVVKKVRIMLPGAPVNLQGFDPNQTSVMRDVGGKFQSMGPASQFMGGGFNQGGFNNFNQFGI